MNRMNLIIFLIAAAFLICPLAACSGLPKEADTILAAQEQTDALPLTTPQAPVPNNMQSGALEQLLLDGAELRVSVTGYAFLQDDCITMDLYAKNGNGNPATVWVLITDVNGWDVRDMQQSMTNVSLAPGEERTFEAVFDLSGGIAQYLQIVSLTELSLSVEGYVDTTDYDYVMQESTLAIPNAPQTYAQPYAELFEAIADNAFLTAAYCGCDPASGAVTLFYEAKTPSNGTSLRLYPIENGVYDMQRYPIPDTLAMQAGAKRLYPFTPVKYDGVNRVTGFYAVADGTPMPPTLLPLPNESAPGNEGALENALAGMKLAAQNDKLCLYYDAASRRFFAENRTQDESLVLFVAEPFTLDGHSVRPTPLFVACFPGTATAFRISGRVQDGGVERNVVIEAGSQTVSARFVVSCLTNYAEESENAETLDVVDFALQEGME